MWICDIIKSMWKLSEDLAKVARWLWGLALLWPIVGCHKDSSKDVLAAMERSGGACAFVSNCTQVAARGMQEKTETEFEDEEQEMLVTGYCNCGKCCGWRKKWYLFGSPVYNYGKMKGAPKKVGVTASGAVAAKGTIAADVTAHPFGTRMWIPGYGPGTVQDIGGSIKGAHIDIWFPSHQKALDWGSRRINVKVAKPAGAEGATTARR